MTGRHWFRKDVLFPLILLAILGYGIYWIWQKVEEMPSLRENRFFPTVFLIGLVVFFLLAVITIRHAISSYALERFNPGNPQSLRRLRRLRRFHLPAGLRNRLREWREPAGDIADWLHSLGYRADARTPHGRVFVKPRRYSFWARPMPVNRVIILQHDLLNVLMIDQLFKDNIRYIRQQSELPSPRNLLLLIMNRDDDNEAISAAAGVVNFLGKFNGGTLGVLMLDLKHNRMFYPVDRTLQPRLHRLFQDLLRWRLVYWLRHYTRTAQPAGIRADMSTARPSEKRSDIRRYNPEADQSGRNAQSEKFVPRDFEYRHEPDDDFVYHSDDEPDEKN